MTKILKYFGVNELLEVTQDSELNGRDFRYRYKCDNPDCLRQKPLLMGMVVTYGSDLHACKEKKECSDSVRELWRHQRKTFSESEFLAERKEYHIQNGIDETTARQYAQFDLKNKMSELRIKTKKRNKNFPEKQKELLRNRVKKATEYMHNGMSRKDAFHKAMEEERELKKTYLPPFISYGTKK